MTFPSQKVWLVLLATLAAFLPLSCSWIEKTEWQRVKATELMLDVTGEKGCAKFELYELIAECKEFISRRDYLAQAAYAIKRSKEGEWVFEIDNNEVARQLIRSDNIPSFFPLHAAVNVSAHVTGRDTCGNMYHDVYFTKRHKMKYFNDVTVCVFIVKHNKKEKTRGAATNWG